MSTRDRQHAARWRRRMVAALTRSTSALQQAWRRIRRWRQPVPIAVLIADPDRRRALERDLQCGLARLQHTLGVPLPSEVAVVVQQVITTDRQISGCYHLGLRRESSRFALVRLALAVNGRQLTTDELLAVLAEQYIALLTRDDPSVLIPVELEPRLAGPQRHPPLRPDPLTPYPDGIDQRGRGA